MSKPANSFLRPLTATALALAFAGCSSQSYDKGTQTATGLKESATLIQTAQGQMDQTLASLDELVNKPSANDLRSQYTKYSTNVDNLGTTANRIKDRVTAMQAKGAEYMAQWEMEVAKIQDEDIKKASAERKQEVTEDLTELKEMYAEASEAFKPVMSDLRDVQSYLGTDLTTKGTTAVKDTANDAIKESKKLREKVNELVAKFNEIGLKLPPPPPPPK